jgi:hypothetical protein
MKDPNISSGTRPSKRSCEALVQFYYISNGVWPNFPAGCWATDLGEPDRATRKLAGAKKESDAIKNGPRGPVFIFDMSFGGAGGIRTLDAGFAHILP